MEETGTCKLCGTETVLRWSHVIPRFVHKWLKESSPGHLRTVNTPDQRIQDGPTERWLCDTCEQRFSDWERVFATRVFQYVHTTQGELDAIAYEEWALKFAVSISWRTLCYYREKGLAHLSSADHRAVDRAEKAWREFLLGTRPHPGEFEQHVLIVDTLSDATADVSPFLNRFLVRTVQSDVVASRSTCFVHTKLCKVIVIGFLRVDRRSEWKGAKVHVKQGTFGRDCKVPGSLAAYWNDQADTAAEALGRMSERQRDKVGEVFRSAGPDKLAATEVFRAMEADVRFSGDRAFSSTKPQPDSGEADRT